MRLMASSAMTEPSTWIDELAPDVGHAGNLADPA
jgi:hypothetical protein